MHKSERRAKPGEARRHLLNLLEYEGDECTSWPFAKLFNDGRAMINWNGKVTAAARVICELANGPAPFERADAAHSCGNGHAGCLTKRHIRWATRKENIADTVRHGRVLRGERSPAAVLDEATVLQIYYSDEPPAKLAEKFGVKPANIAHIKRGDSWSWLTGQTPNSTYRRKEAAPGISPEPHKTKWAD